ncbi:desumoylating isopeptidase 1-like [Tubulinosema ratisbonensis]|uniref:Desumoylating isopeptidase 1-like n=1 Tax=Tubulinosema ratisbonensis TaxID=291195 RepID=A0A437AMH9_9MICR|nr:desumoylating isopeptidase 1-like [Tubulinosema ratisbonensis]
MVEKKENKSEKVVLRIYDLSRGQAKIFAKSFNLDIEGIWHTSVEVFGREYYFQNGIIHSEPGKTHHGEALERIEMGITQLTSDLFVEFLNDMNHKYNEFSYNLFKNNCNHFSNDVTLFLVGKSIPDHILSLPDTFMKSPLYKMLMGGQNDEDKKDNA